MAKKKAQQEEISLTPLPLKENQGLDVNLHYIQLGFHIFPQKDDLFVNVQLPKGWSVKYIDTLYHKLVDDKGQDRALIFYKQGEDALPGIAYISFYKKYYYTVCDAGYAVWEINEKGKENLFLGSEQECKDFLEQEFPNHANLLAYW